MKSILFILGILLTLPSLAQGPEEDKGMEGALELMHRESRKQLFIPLGQTIIIGSDAGLRVKGSLEWHSKDSIQIDGQRFAMQSVEWIGLRSWTSHLAASAMAIVGLGVATGGILYASNQSSSSLASSGMIVIVGAGITSLAVPKFINGRKLWLDSDWKYMNPSR